VDVHRDVFVGFWRRWKWLRRRAGAYVRAGAYLHRDVNRHECARADGGRFENSACYSAQLAQSERHMAVRVIALIRQAGDRWSVDPCLRRYFCASIATQLAVIADQPDIHLSPSTPLM